MQAAAMADKAVDSGRGEIAACPPAIPPLTPAVRLKVSTGSSFAVHEV